MRCRIYLAISAIAFLALADRSWAQQNNVTFSVPVNLSQLSPNLTILNVRCTIQSTALPGGSAFAIAFLHNNDSGRIVTTANVRVAIPTLDISAGANATYTCSLSGQTNTTSQQGFSANATVPAFRLSPTPAPITGSFSWLDAPAAPTADAPPPPASTSPPPGGN